MLARSAVFDIYGDHLLATTGWAPVAALVQLTGVVDVAPAATRTAISRMAREGWLDAETRSGVRGYALTSRARHRLASAAQRIYADRTPEWDGEWHLVVVEHSADRSVRARVRGSMEYLGYARLAADTWVAPRPSDDLAETLGDGYREFRSRLTGDPVRFAAEMWDLDALAEAHNGYIRWLADLVADLPDVDAAGDLECYTTRSLALHEWRKFLFTDPGLPLEVLPPDWPGSRASKQFRDVAACLRPGAAGYVDTCIRTALGRSTTDPTDGPNTEPNTEPSSKPNTEEIR